MDMLHIFGDVNAHLGMLYIFGMCNVCTLTLEGVLLNTSN